ncbi:cell division protein FtsQ/DivIB [Thermodesulfatator autotrophicus]|uniref:POTRA domain-containing protein n=1 Tax=Thermodesulfatator autotrophicus TaxID=1795632 RepID=A0A177E7S3_9BACT|nr:FtsQ-type POTRA domain-containing protein [Thermodesulfatator autotrophicus]OAG27994.1 hypothetical protein TH606_03940 [Thermodesulfatator autotrophicus]
MWWAKAKKFLVLLIGFMTLAALVVAGVYIKKSPYFALSGIEITIEGKRFLSKRDVFERANLILGTNIFALNLKEVKKRLEFHPWVAEAFVSRKLPNRVFIKVKEEKPIAMLSINGEIWLVNEKGYIFARAPRVLLKELPALEGVSSKEIENRHLDPQKLEVLRLLVKLKKNETLVPPYANISQIKFLPDGFLLLTRDALLIKFAGNSLKEYEKAYKKLDRIFVYLYDTKQYHRVKMVRLDYPENSAALIFKKGQRS